MSTDRDSNDELNDGYEGENDEFNETDNSLEKKKKPPKGFKPTSQEYAEAAEETEDIERVTFLKEYAQDSTRSLEQVASQLKIPQKSAEKYLKKYIYLMINTISDEDNPRRVRTVLNEKLISSRKPKKDLITDAELTTLKPLVERYGDLDVVDTAHRKNATQRLMSSKPSNAFGFNVSNEPFGGGEPQAYTGPHMGKAPDGEKDRPYKPYANLSGSGRSNLMRWVLERSPYIHYSKIDPFVELFETNELKLMGSPDELFRFMSDYFGPVAGKVAFNQYKDMITSYLKPNEQFGQNPYYGQGTGGYYYGGGGWGSNMGPAPGQGGPGMGYYEAMGVLPPGVDPRSPEAKRVIWEFEEDRRKKKASEEMQENIKNYVNLKMMDIVDPSKQGGGGMFGGPGGNAWMGPMLMSGALRMEQAMGADGQPVWRTVPGAMAGQNGDHTTDHMLKMVELMMGMYNSVIAANAQTPKFMETLLTSMIGKFNTQSDPFELAVNAKKLADTFNPPSGIHQTIETAKLLIAREKMSTDKELTITKMNQDWNREMYERDRQDKQEDRSSQQTNEIVKSIFSIGGQAIVPLLTMFMGRGGPGAAALAGMIPGMAGQAGMGMPPGMGPGGMPPGMPPGVGMPFEGGGGGPGMAGGPTMGQAVDMNDIIQRQTVAGQGNPQWYAEPSDQFGYGANPGGPPAPQYRPPTVQEQWAAYGTQQEPVQRYSAPPTPGPQQEEQEVYAEPSVVEAKRTYSEKDFENYSLEDLQRLRNEGSTSRDSIDSFNNALTIAIQRKSFGTPQPRAAPPPPQPQMTMPSNIPIQETNEVAEDNTNPSAPIVGAGGGRSILDDMTEEGESLIAETKDLQILPDVPTAEETEKKKNGPQQSQQLEGNDTGGDIG